MIGTSAEVRETVMVHWGGVPDSVGQEGFTREHRYSQQIQEPKEQGGIPERIKELHEEEVEWNIPANKELRIFPMNSPPSIYNIQNVSPKQDDGGEIPLYVSPKLCVL
ncbi:hypothetical protein E2542_SST30256 [Spatholobus suberectus]|nr:hypothetical protein E2542_SST30256 [Spatholobus suberectus]